MDIIDLQWQLSRCPRRQLVLHRRLLYDLGPEIRQPGHLDLLLRVPGLSLSVLSPRFSVILCSFTLCKGGAGALSPAKSAWNNRQVSLQEQLTVENNTAGRAYPFWAGQSVSILVWKQPNNYEFSGWLIGYRVL